jgi:hypothetical protein
MAMLRNSKIIQRGGLTVALMAVALTPAAWLYSRGMLRAAWPPFIGSLPPQPIEFNHKVHLERIQGVHCYDCHQFVTTQAYAGLPSKYICFGCHDPYADEGDKEADAFQPKFASLMAFAKSDDDIPWHRVTRIPEHVFFSHRTHVVVAELDCRECHAEMPDRTSPPTRGPIEMAMAECIECHAKKEADVDCIACHR